MTIELRQTGPSTSQVAIRDHRVTIDRPTDKGGTDAGPMGGELFLTSIGGCFMSNLLAAIASRNAAVSDAVILVEATVSGTPPIFTRIELVVSATCADSELLSKIVEIADRGCIMMNTLRGKLDLSVRIAA